MKHKAYIKLIRPKHYLKNLLVFLPLIFSGHLFEKEYFIQAILAFMSFSMVASAVYVINDLKDKKLDALHPRKKHRPIASGLVGTTEAIVVIICLIGLAALFQYFANISLSSVGLLTAYFIINVCYSFGLKNVPVIDVLILSLGFVLRVLYGGYSLDIEVSKWLYLSVLAFSFYLGLGKRRNEIRITGKETRKVNRYYSHEFLDKNMYVCLGLAIAYYSLWSVDPSQSNESMVWTIPVVIAIVMAYSLAIESSESDGDPVSVVTSSPHLLALIVIYGAIMTYLVYM